MIRVIIESPYAGEVEKNLAYLHRCIRDCLDRGEAPFASHLMYTTALDDTIHEEREKGIAAGLAWHDAAEKVVAYIDRGISNGMYKGLRAAHEKGVPVEIRKID